MYRSAALVILLAMPALGAAQTGDAPLTVCAAVSLTDSLEAAVAIYKGEGGGPVRFNFAGSNTLARQLVNGAPADLFISADEAQMNVAAAAGAIDRTTRVDLVANRLAVIVRPGREDLRDVRELLRPDVRRVAIGDPDAVPAGVYARQYLKAIGIWEAMQPRLVPVGNVRAALAAVENGSVDAGIVYETDAAIASRAGTAFVVAGDRAPRIVYPAAIVTVSRNREAAARFLRFLQGPKAAELFRRHHFSPIAR